MVAVDTSDEYLLYSELCFIPSEYDDLNVAIGNTTRGVCRELCSETYSLQCSAFLYDRSASSCVLTPFSGESVQGSEAISELQRGCDGSMLEFYRRTRHLGMYWNCAVRLNDVS